MLIDTFVNAIFLYDDKMEITYNYHEGTTTVTFEELQKIIENQALGSDMNSVGAPRKPLIYKGFRFFYARKYPNLTQTIPNHHMFSMKACILFADSRRMVSVT